jgi:HTH-type transcriptional regulator/antitoxin HigA
MSPTFQTTTPARLVPPGDILRRELVARGWQGKDLAEIMGRPEQLVSQILTGKKQITEETALQLGEALGVDARFWINLETNYRLAVARRATDDEGITRRRRLRELVPCWREVVRRGWLPNENDLENQERATRTLLGIESLEEEPTLALCRRHGLDDNPEKRGLQMIWAKRVESLARQRRVPAFSLAGTMSALDDLMKLAAREEHVAKVPRFLERQGIVFVIVPHLDKTRMEGAAWPQRPSPILALTIRYDRIDNFWFNLLHELGHIIHGHKGVILDTEEDMMGAAREEQEANAFASKLLHRARIKSLWERTRPSPTKKQVIELATELSLHPGIVAGQLRSIANDHKYHRNLDAKVRHHLADWIDE